MFGRFLRLIFIAIFVLPIKEACTNPVILPKPNGPYSVGTMGIELKDSTRRMLRDPTQRCWMVQAFYPADLHTDKTYPYMPSTLKDGLLKEVYVYAHSKPNAPILKSGPFPIIIFIPGLGGVRQDYTILCEELASHGYIVLSLDQPYVSNFVCFLNYTKIVPSFKDVWRVPKDRDYRYKYYDEAMTAAIADVEYMLNNLDELNVIYLENQVNKQLILLMGHSFGGNVAHTLGFTDKRIKAIIDIDSKITEKEIYGRIGVPPNPEGKPVLFIRAILQYQESVGDQLTKIQNAYILNYNVQHSAFKDISYLARKIMKLNQQGLMSRVWDWFFKKGPIFEPVDTDIGEKDIEEWFIEFKKDIIDWMKSIHQKR